MSVFFKTTLLMNTFRISYFSSLSLRCFRKLNDSNKNILTTGSSYKLLLENSHSKFYSVIYRHLQGKYICNFTSAMSEKSSDDSKLPKDTISNKEPSDHQVVMEVEALPTREVAASSVSVSESVAKDDLSVTCSESTVVKISSVEEGCSSAVDDPSIQGQEKITNVPEYDEETVKRIQDAIWVDDGVCHECECVNDIVIYKRWILLTQAPSINVNYNIGDGMPKSEEDDEKLTACSLACGEDPLKSTTRQTGDEETKQLTDKYKASVSVESSCSSVPEEGNSDLLEPQISKNMLKKLRKKVKSKLKHRLASDGVDEASVDGLDATVDSMLQEEIATFLQKWGSKKSDAEKLEAMQEKETEREKRVLRKMEAKQEKEMMERQVSLVL